MLASWQISNLQREAERAYGNGASVRQYIDACLSGCHTRIAGAVAKHGAFQADRSVSSDAGAVVMLASIRAAGPSERRVNRKRTASRFQELSMRNVSCTPARSWQARSSPRRASFSSLRRYRVRGSFNFPANTSGRGLPVGGRDYL